jgi:hypothetical protein
MRPVQGGTQKLTMNSTENDYQQKLRQAQAQADGNPFVAGIQEVFNAGASVASKESASNQYGNVNLMPQEVLEGSFSNYQQNDAPANSPMNDPMNQSASMETGTSMTTSNPAEGPEELATDKLTERLNMYAKAGSNANFGHNNRQETMRLG